MVRRRVVAVGVAGTVLAAGAVSLAVAVSRPGGEAAARHTPVREAVAGQTSTGEPVAGQTSAGQAVAGQPPARPDSSGFTAGRVTNPWFPLKPGTRFVYRGVEGGARTRDVVYVTHVTRVVDGVTCRSVSDRLFANGHLAERTTDWYAQSRDGTVWYFGERTAELDGSGKVTSREGSWLAGRDGARAGIFIDAAPRVGQTHYQEYYPGHAEDRYRVVSISGSVSEPLLRSEHAVVTREWSPLEAGVVSHKFYVRDVGSVGELSVKGPRETSRRVSVTHVG